MELRLEGRKMRLMIVVTMINMASMTMASIVRGWSRTGYCRHCRMAWVVTCLLLLMLLLLLSLPRSVSCRLLLVAVSGGCLVAVCSTGLLLLLILVVRLRGVVIGRIVAWRWDTTRVIVLALVARWGGLTSIALVAGRRRLTSS